MTTQQATTWTETWKRNQEAKARQMAERRAVIAALKTYQTDAFGLVTIPEE